MKNIILVVALFLGYSVVAKAQIKLRKFEVLKTADGKLQFCAELDDYYQAGTYTLHGISNKVTGDALVEATVLAVGRKCQKYTTSNGTAVFVWRELNLFKEYKYEYLRYVGSNLGQDYVTVKSENQMLVIADRSFNTLAEVKLNEQHWGVGDALFTMDLKKGILPENLDQFNNGDVVTSVFFIYIKSDRTETPSWDEAPVQYLYTGPAYSFIYYIQKTN